MIKTDVCCSIPRFEMDRERRQVHDWEVGGGGVTYNALKAHLTQVILNGR